MFSTDFKNLNYVQTEKNVSLLAPVWNRLWITLNGIEVNQGKISALQEMLSKYSHFWRSVHSVKSLNQTFLDIAWPLSNLTKKNSIWRWSGKDKQTFLTLKRCLINSPLLKLINVTKSIIIRIHASSRNGTSSRRKYKWTFNWLYTVVF